MEVVVETSSSRSLDTLLEAGREMVSAGRMRRCSARSGLSSVGGEPPSASLRDRLDALRRQNRALKRLLLQLHPHLSFAD